VINGSSTLNRVKGWYLPLIGVPALFLIAFIYPYFHTSFKFCFIKRVTGLDCPGCGMTRGMSALTHLHFMDAILFNPLSPIVALWLLYKFYQYLYYMIRKQRFELPLSAGSTLLLSYTFLGALIFVWVFKLIFGLAGTMQLTPLNLDFFH